MLNSYNGRQSAYRKKGAFLFLKDKHTAYAAILSACGIIFYAPGGMSITPQQLVDIFSLIDKPKPIEAILEYIDTLDVPGDDEVVEYSDDAFAEIPNLLSAEQKKYSPVFEEDSR